MNYKAWAEWYDVFYSTAPPDDIDFYVSLARESGGPVLEMGVGTGRIAIPTASEGIDVIGVDLNEPMLRRARQKIDAAGPLPGDIELVQADMRRLALGGRTFPLVTIPARTLLLATTPEDQAAALRAAARHVAPGGRLAFNVFAPDPEMLTDTSDEPFEMGEAVNPETGRRCVLSAVNRFDTTAQTNHGLQIVEELDDDGAVVRSVTLDVLVRYLQLDEALALAEQAGLAVTDVFGDFHRSPLDDDSEEMIFICEKSAG
ncbi:MAG: class I SAM-dependent methyltransferase [Dehalococcoidia bacterium]